MLELLKNYTVSDILIFIVFLAIATKGVVNFIDWLRKKGKVAVKAATAQEESRKKIMQQVDKIAKQTQETQDKVTYLTDSNDIVFLAIKDLIKTQITQQHHFFVYEQQWIDDYSLDCLERCFGHYLKMGGNSFIEDLMKELRDLPKVPPVDKEKKGE